jgi:hypothetical protein
LAGRRTYVFIGIIVGVAIVIGVVFGTSVFRSSAPPSITSGVGKTDAVEPRIYPPDSEPYGLTYANWSAKWWQWYLSMPVETNPVNDATGKNCANNQDGPVWFLAGTSGGKVVRECEMPSGKAIFFPIINGACNAVQDNVRTEEEFRNCIIPFVDQVNHVEATIDGVKLQGLQGYRVLSPLFNVTFAKGNPVGAPEGTIATMSDGWWIFLEPLPEGRHEINFKGIQGTPAEGGGSGFAVDVTYHINIQS